MVTDPITPATIARAEERRRLTDAGIQDESLVDHIVEALIDERTAHHDALTDRFWLDKDDIERMVTLAAQETAKRIEADIIAKGWSQARGHKAFRYGLYEAARIAKEVRL